MNKKSYAEKLKDPRWQKKRLEILERDDFQCQACWDDKTTLHVHHIEYENGKDPWDYEDDNFLTLCEDCHSENHLVDGRLVFARNYNNEHNIKKLTTDNGYVMIMFSNLDYLHISVWHKGKHLFRIIQEPDWGIEMIKFFTNFISDGHSYEICCLRGKIKTLRNEIKNGSTATD